MRHGGSLRVRIALAVCAVVLCAAPTAAHAESWMSEYPFGTIYSTPYTVGADIFGTTALSSTSASIRLDGIARRTYLTQGTASGHWVSTYTLVDGAYVIHWDWVPDTGGTTKGNIYCYPPTLADGLHTVTATVRSVAGTTYTHSWTFTIAASPVIDNVAPSADTTVTTRTPLISAKITDNVGVTSVTATVNGIAATVGAPVGGVYPVTGFTLASDGPVTVRVTASDAAGNTTWKQWRFTVYTVDASCVDPDCHGPSYLSGHMGSTACSMPACHPDRVVPHGFSESGHTAEFGSNAVAGTWTMALAPGQVFAGVQVNAPLAYNAGCASCHSPVLTTEHAKATAAPVNSPVCLDCHPAPRNTITGGWNKSCATSGCHTAAGQFHPATATVADHAVAASLATCTPEGVGCSGTPGEDTYARTPCHTTDLIQEHNRKLGGFAPFPTQVINRTFSVSCEQCHQSARYLALNGNWDGTCDACHPQNHSVVGSARYAEVRAQHQASRYYDSGLISSTGVAILGVNTMDSHGPMRTATSSGRRIPYGCANQTCHLNFWLAAGLDGYYPANGCPSCHGANIAPLVAYQGSYMWSSGAWNDGASYTTSLTLDLRATPLPAASALDFKTYYDIEQDWDYGYVQVSTDGGTAWTTLASTLTTSTNPNGANLGNGITGNSNGDWVDAHFDLSAYAGQAIKIRFNYVCDAYTYGDGWLLDTLVVGPPGSPIFSDDVETLKPEWTSASNRTRKWSR